MKTNEKSKSVLEDDKRTLEKRKNVREKLKQRGEADENIDQILISLEHYCILILESIKNQ